VASRDDAQGGGRSKAGVEAIGPRHSQYLCTGCAGYWLCRGPIASTRYGTGCAGYLNRYWLCRAQEKFIDNQEIEPEVVPFVQNFNFV
jgi:hypothetical protein